MLFNSPALVFRYLRECYELDTKTLNLSNFYSRKVENRIWVEGTDEVLSGRLPYLPILDDFADKFEENLSKYSKEKSLYVFAHFLVGYENGKRVCAPLIFIPAEIIENEGYRYLKPNQGQKFLNHNFLNSYKKEGSPNFDELFDFLLLSDTIDFGVTGKIASVLEEHFDGIEASQLRLFPDLCPERRVKSRRPKDHLEAHAGMGVGVLRYSSKTLGIKSELDALSDLTRYSKALDSVLSGDNETEKLPKAKIRVPSILSKEQSRVLKNSLTYTKSIVIGPPGTGKSFTIANMAVDHVLRQKSVLIVSKTDEAVDVVFEKLSELGMKKALMRAGKQQYLRELKSRIENLLTQSHRPYLWAQLQELKDSGDFIEANLLGLEEKFIKGMKSELRWGERLFEDRDNTGVIAKLRTKYVSWRTKVKTPNWKTTEAYYLGREKTLSYYRELVTLSYNVQLDSFLHSSRSELTGFLKGIRARTLSKQDKIFGELSFSQILRTFPIWLCKLSDLFEVLPLEENLFDLVVIDEASQVDLASVMPALQRAKKVVVVGDQNQLRHFSFVSRGQQDSLIRKNFLTKIENKALLAYRDSSILDLCFDQCNSNDQVVFLDEHFRGNQELMQYSNERFYADRLKMMKSLPIHEYQSVFIEQVSGVRTSAGVNEEEINEIIKYVTKLSDGVLSEASLPSIGILSPFRKQTERIVERLHIELDPEVFQKHRILVGTPYSFQGNERDIMILSWAIDDDTHHSALRYINNPQVFNVAITRAKRKMVNLISFNPKLLPSNIMLRAYLSSSSKEIARKVTSKEIHDTFMQEVSEWLGEIGCSHECDYEVASIPVDILITSNEKYKAIDLVGFPGEFFDTIDLTQYMLLQRAGVSVFPLPYTYWFFQKEYAKKEFMDFLLNDN